MIALSQLACKLGRGIIAGCRVIESAANGLEQLSMQIQDRIDTYEQENQWWQRGFHGDTEGVHPKLPDREYRSEDGESGGYSLSA
jgi:hypothetical protein